jgi:hypothetical protein
MQCPANGHNCRKKEGEGAKPLVISYIGVVHQSGTFVKYEVVLLIYSLTLPGLQIPVFD